MYKNGLVTVLTRGDQEGPDNPVEKKYMHMKWMVDANENNGWPPIEKKPERKKKHRWYPFLVLPNPKHRNQICGRNCMTKISIRNVIQSWGEGSVTFMIISIGISNTSRLTVQQ